ncbi:MAG: hypothetical protein OEV23_09065 [Gallionella sp.]|nr:hypothetical protein [Gallionella sp.]
MGTACNLFQECQDEALHKDGHQIWQRLVLHEFNDGKQFEAVIHEYETWSQPSDMPEPVYRGLRGEGDLERNRERAARRAKKKIRHACKSAQFDRMLTLTTRDAIFDRAQFQRMIEKFIRLVRKATGDAMPYVLTLEKHNSKKTSEAKRGSLHAHVGVRGRQDYKLLQSVWNYRVCGGQGFVRVSNGSKNMRPGQIAGYISKYISKTISEVETNKKSYWISHNIVAPVRSVKLFKTLSEAFRWLVSYWKSTGNEPSFDSRHCWQDTSLGVYWFTSD